MEKPSLENRVRKSPFRVVGFAVSNARAANALTVFDTVWRDVTGVSSTVDDGRTYGMEIRSSACVVILIN